jgi:hypothetical protein
VSHRSSIARRLLFRLLFGFAVAPGLAAIILLFAVNLNADARVDPRIEAQADAVSVLLHIDASGHLALDTEALGHSALLSGARFGIYDGRSSDPVLRWPARFTFRHWEMERSYETVRVGPIGLVRLIFAPAPDDWSRSDRAWRRGGTAQRGDGAHRVAAARESDQ